jgi:putative heme-binding domain-containing protein
MPREQWSGLVLAESNPLGAIEGLVALSRTAKSPNEFGPIFEKEIGLLRTANLSANDRLRLLRAFDLTAIAAKDGAPATVRKQVHELIAPLFPAHDERLDMEYARTLAYCGQPEAISKILGAMPKGDEDQPLQIHYAYCLRDIKTGWTPEQKTALAQWFGKAVEWRGGASFTGYLNFMFDSALEFYDKDEKKMAYERVPAFAPLDASVVARTNKAGFALPRVLERKKGVTSVSPEEIFQYQMFDPMTLKAKADAGKPIFEKECASCHRHGGLGKDFGPDLTTIRNRFKKKDVLEAILWPSKTISDQYQSYIIETQDHDLINGLIVTEDAKKLVVKTAEVERPIEIPKTAVKDRRISKISIMPEHLLDGYGMDQIANLLAFLQSGTT